MINQSCTCTDEFFPKIRAPCEEFAVNTVTFHEFKYCTENLLCVVAAVQVIRQSEDLIEVETVSRIAVGRPLPAARLLSSSKAEPSN